MQASGRMPMRTGTTVRSVCPIRIRSIHGNWQVKGSINSTHPSPSPPASRSAIEYNITVPSRIGGGQPQPQAAIASCDAAARLPEPEPERDAVAGARCAHSDPDSNCQPSQHPSNDPIHPSVVASSEPGPLPALHVPLALPAVVRWGRLLLQPCRRSAPVILPANSPYHALYSMLYAGADLAVDLPSVDL